ncbi:hypothetical protein [Bacillus wiedmannii]|uniref:hypothetical protein n=1 Tax=Bacillus wiedmannii TaxID=1890302 RepID=UPI003650DB7B
MTGDSSRWSWISFKAEVACSECEGDGAFDVEALFASQEKAKPPKHSSYLSWIIFKAKAARLEQELYIKQNPYYSTVIGIFIYNSS